jgi:uncharacterized integral membrane protein
MTSPTRRLVQALRGAVPGAAVGLLVALSFIVLVVVTCSAAVGNDSARDGRGWVFPLSVVVGWTSLIAGPVIGAVVGGVRALRGSRAKPRSRSTPPTAQ